MSPHFVEFRAASLRRQVGRKALGLTFLVSTRRVLTSLSWMWAAETLVSPKRRASDARA